MIKNDEKMIKEYLNQYEYDTDYECDIDTVYNIVEYVQIMLALLINNRGGDAALWEGRSSRQGSSWLLLV
jgi:hypothetical protein